MSTDAKPAAAPTEEELLAAEVARNVRKAERAMEREADNALRLQQQWAMTTRNALDGWYA